MKQAHGTRAAYKAGCVCVRCRAANTTYQVRRRLRRLRAGDSRAWALEARRRVRQLEREGYTKTRIARLCGFANPRGYQVTFKPGQRIRWGTLRRILRVARFAMLEGVDLQGG